MEGIDLNGLLLGPIVSCAYLQKTAKSVAVLGELQVSFELDGRFRVSTHGDEVGNTLAWVDQPLDQGV